MEIITINGHSFQLIKALDKKNIEALKRHSGCTLRECYKNPSEFKEFLYYFWLKWAIETGIKYFGVSSYNKRQFSLQGLYEDEYVKKYILDITRNNEKAYIIN